VRVEEGRGCLYTPVQEHLPHFLIINQKEKWVKFNKGVIIKSKPMKRNKIFLGRRDVQDMIKDKITMWSGSFTNTWNVHTCPVCSMDLIMAGVVIMHSQLVEVPGDMVGGARVHVPMIVWTRGGGSSSTWLGNIIFFKLMPIIIGRVSNLQTDLTLGPRRFARAPPGSIVAASVRRATEAATPAAISAAIATAPERPATTSSIHRR
jgi:hypothetical protein